MARFVMTGGGTGGHVIPALAVARELQGRGHEVVFVGSQHGLEARLVPEAGFPIEHVAAGGLKRVGLGQTLRTLWNVPLGTWQAWRLLGRLRPAGLFSMGGYVAGPVTLAAWLRRVPVVLMEPNAMPGLTTRLSGRLARKALLSFEEGRRFFPPGVAEITGLPVRAEFFTLPPKRREEPFAVLVTGGSRGSRTLNQAARQSWPLFRGRGPRLRMGLQTGSEMEPELQQEFATSGLDGAVSAFVQDMPAAFAQADLVVCRAGAGAVAELAAAGKPAILVPFPFAADDHQLRNAEALERAGAALLVRDQEMTGERLHREVSALAADAPRLARMGEAARTLARPGAAARAADLLEQFLPATADAPQRSAR